MASLTVLTDPVSSIDYLMNGEVTKFCLEGTIVLSKKDNIEINGWENQLLRFIYDHDLQINCGKGLHAFVYRALDELIKKENK